MLPEFTIQGILPPFVGGDPTFADCMSPYRTTMPLFVQRFGNSTERIKIIKGLLGYRAALLAAGLTGFQWLSGSFVEKVEVIRGRPPGDVDVVSVINRPADFAADDKWTKLTEGEVGDLLFDSALMKATFHCDAYVIDMNEPGVDIVESTRFWYGLFSHQRVTSVWKGIVVVELDAQQDAEARSILANAAPAVTT